LASGLTRVGQEPVFFSFTQGLRFVMSVRRSRPCDVRVQYSSTSQHPVRPWPVYGKRTGRELLGHTERAIKIGDISRFWQQRERVMSRMASEESVFSYSTPTRQRVGGHPNFEIAQNEQGRSRHGAERGTRRW